MQYETIFDIAGQTYSASWLAVPAIISIILGIYILISLKVRQLPLWIGVIALISTLFVAGTGFYFSYQYFAFLQSAIDTGEALIVQGPIDEYEPKLVRSRGSLEGFSVDGVRFEYSGYGFSYGYNIIKAEGSLLEEGLMVRIYYYRNIILRLEVLQRA